MTSASLQCAAFLPPVPGTCVIAKYRDHPCLNANVDMYSNLPMLFSVSSFWPHRVTSFLMLPLTLTIQSINSLLISAITLGILLPNLTGILAPSTLNIKVQCRCMTNHSPNIQHSLVVFILSCLGQAEHQHPSQNDVVRDPHATLRNHARYGAAMSAVPYNSHDVLSMQGRGMRDNGL
ncbi:hypothetical protein K469DRAFT_263181 [Zopfia rhizophila CBS 207.26]|uniref:Uncharacterized protein n=1 Tax=Zopfia rhizophila CBS 207.26 TaxID=1314779 RepID=A0A6A6DT90_9PEZI|nr:hypothetical protein K469DRAFT_263181 [Zopfia rhizophila CBS 207.26]